MGDGPPDHRWHRPPPRPGPGPRPDVPARHVRPPHRGQRGQLHQDRRRRPPRPGLPARLRRGHRLGLGRLRRRGRSPATPSPSSASAASAPTPSRAPSWPAPSGSSPSTRSRTSGRRPWSSAPPTPRRRSTRPCPLITDITWGTMANKVIMTMGVGDGAGAGRGAGHRRPSGAGSSSPTSTRRSRCSASVSLLDLTLMEKQVVGSLFGSGNPRYDIPKLLGPVPRGPARPRRPRHQDLHARRRQRGLRGHARRQATSAASWSTTDRRLLSARLARHRRRFHGPADSLCCGAAITRGST